MGKFPTSRNNRWFNTGQEWTFSGDFGQHPGTVAPEMMIRLHDLSCRDRISEIS
jgi:hypothetical protein